MKKNNSLFSLVNVSVKKPISEKRFASLIRQGLLRVNNYAQIFAFFTELPVNAILNFIKKNKLKASRVFNYYNKNVKRHYRNPAFEEYFKYAK